MIRPKHIFIPIIALLLAFGYAEHANTQAAKFDSEIWKSTDEYREDMLAPLMGYVLKVGQSRDEVREKLGFPVRETFSSHCSRWDSDVGRETYETGFNLDLIVIYSCRGTVTDFHLGKDFSPFPFYAMSY